MSRFFLFFTFCLPCAVSGVHAAVTAVRNVDPAPAVEAGATHLPGVLAQRNKLMQQGIAGLATGNTSSAVMAFESAVSMVHAPDAELGLVRSYMQAGEYRKALSYAAHTAGAHKEEPEGTALYAWLLYLGGQEAAAKRLLLEAQARTPGNPVLAWAHRRMDSGFATSSGKADASPAFAPYSQPPLKAATAAVSGSGVLIDGGRHALVPLSSVAHVHKIWLRNGLGQLRPGAVERRFKKEGIALLTLNQSFAPADGFMTAGADPFPGSVVYAVEYAMVPGALPDWPVLRHGFLGTPAGDGPDWALGITMPIARHGGPVFDASGALVGVAVSSQQGESMFLPISRIRHALGERLGPAAPLMKRARISMEQVYENAMRVTVQVLTAR